MNRIRVLALAASSLLAVAGSCNSPVVAFLTPTAGGEVTFKPLRIELRLRQDVVVSSFAASLNGADVTAAFSLVPESGGSTLAVALDVWDGVVVLSGANTLEVSVERDNGATAQVSATFDAVGDPYADAVLAFNPGTGAGVGVAADALGPPTGSGLYSGADLGVVTLGLGGSIDLAFTDNVIVDGPGVDFLVFENAFLVFNQSTFVVERVFSEPGTVWVSQDGLTWHAFPCNLAGVPFEPGNPESAVLYPGCAGEYPVLADANDPLEPHASIPTDKPIEEFLNQFVAPQPPGAGGDRFDLADLGLGWVAYVRIVGTSVVDGPVGGNNAGFDLDAVAAVNAAPATDVDGNGIPDAVQ